MDDTTSDRALTIEDMAECVSVWVRLMAWS
jgi:hypothetical protein